MSVAPAPRLEAHFKYIADEANHDDVTPDRVQLAYERAIVENALSPQLWEAYGSYADEYLQLGDFVVQVYERSVRNCPWGSALWLVHTKSE